ncbi:cell surface protein SprA [Prevotella sp. E15-22]|uniref:T9SS outer membrane translocon Sov/SprA n=1 Tax=Prevotella sp. E15-22 TaxID=2937774 RepID=UPI00205C437D|nr:cell surface protein SprA [Prevotella sp. E15-22]UPS45904.1 cell surface protein SprA [Prevotella sp. E15-22]
MIGVGATAQTPDSLSHPRWKIQKTAPVITADLDTSALDLRMPDNVRQQVEYNDSLNLYYIGSKLGDSYLNAPVVMTPAEYMRWSERRARQQFFRTKDAETARAKGKEKFDFSDMHFDLGPAEKIFGPGGVRVKTQGTAELKLGATLKNIENPSLPIRNRKTTAFDFDEKVNLSVTGKVGDKVNLKLDYRTDATFDFDSKNLKLKYEGKEDEIIKLVEAGNVTFPSNNSLVHGASALFGIRTDMQFGKLKLQTVISQKKSTSKSVSSRGGTQTNPYEINVADYEDNRHFFLSHFFRQNYDKAMSTLPNLTTGVKINRVEIWVTNKTGTTSNSRNLVAFSELGEDSYIINPNWHPTGMKVSSNQANDLYSTLVQNIDSASRSIDQVTVFLEGFGNKLVGGVDYEKLASARLLSSSEYTVNTALGYVSLKTGLQTDQVLAVAFEYTYGGQTYQVGEFSTDVTQTSKCLFVKSLKNTSNYPEQANWRLMMKNVYYLASTVEKEKFKMDIKYQSDTTGTYLTYLPEEQLKQTTLLKVMGLDRLDANMKPHPNGQFDFVSGYTVSNGRIFLPAAEPFGNYLRNYLESKGMGDLADKYCFDQLYDSTKTVAKQNAEKNKYILTGQFKGTSANVISLGAAFVPEGSVVVTAGGVRLQEGSDYSVDYSAGEVTILNQSIIDAGTNVSVSLEDNTSYGMQRKTMLGMNWEYDFSKSFQLGGTLMHLTEQPMTTKVNMGDEPLNNTIWGLNVNWKQESQWLTNVLDKLPLLHVTQPSHVSFTGEFAHLIARNASGTQDNASYIDDFENTKDLRGVGDPKAWVLCSVPSMFANHNDKTTVSSGYERALLAWYNVDPIFTRRSSSLTPSHIKNDLDQLSNHYVREVYVRELYPNRDQSSYNGAVSTLPILDLAYYPQERGPYNLTLDYNADGTLRNPKQKWGGMMRRLETTDFEQANIEYVEFWLLDPFIYTRKEGTAAKHSGDLYINLGEVSEDVLRDGKKFYESGMPVDGTSQFEETQWGKIPVQATQTYAFATTSGSREKQDVGLNGLTDEEERHYGGYANWLNSVSSVVSNDSLLQAWREDPAGDDYHYFRGSDFDAKQTSILERYKRINNPQGNSPANDNQTEGYDTSYKTGPDVEDINQDYTLNEYERYYQYHIPINDDELQAYNHGVKSDNSHIVDHRDYTAKLRNGDTLTVRWYQYRIPLAEFDDKIGSINGFTSIRYMRMFLTNFEAPIVLRFGSLDLVRGEWRQYKQNLMTSAGAETGLLEMSAVNVEENTDRQPVAYVLPPGITRMTDPNQPQLTESNEQALCLTVKNLSQNESKAVYKNQNLNLRQYKRLQMFVHANHLVPNNTQLEDNQLAVFIRLGSDYKNNYYEYLIPLKLTPQGNYRWNVPSDRPLVWPEENMLDIDMSIFTAVKKSRNKARGQGLASYNAVYSEYDPNKPNNKVSIVGNPSLAEVKTMVIGVRNLSSSIKSGEVWVNELRLRESNNEGGWAASGALNVQLSDFGSVNMTGRYITDGFGGLEESILQRSTDTQKSYAVTANLELGKLFPEKAKVSAPLYYSYTKEVISPKYNPLDTDMELDDALESAADKRERDSIESIAVTKHTSRNFSLSNMRVDIKNKRFPLPIDPANFSFSYSHAHRNTTGQTTVYENDDQWRGSVNYNYSPVYKTWEPFKNSKSKSKWMQFPKALGFNYLPQNISFNSELMRNYYELQERDLENTENPSLPLTFSQQFLWNREFQLRWDFTKNLHMSFQSATHAEIEEPYTPVNKDLYPDRYTAWKDSVWTSIKHWGTPLDYQQSFSASYQLPLDKLPILDWVKSDASYTATYSWLRGTELDDGTSLGNTISNNRNLTVNGTFNMETLYNHIPFLKKTNERFKKAISTQPKKPAKKTTTTSNESKDSKDTKNQKDPKDAKAQQKEAAELPKNKNTFQKEITLLPDTQIVVQHGKKSKRLLVSARNKDGRKVNVKWKVVDENKIKVYGADSLQLKLSITPKEPLDKQWWYNPAQQAARLLMMLRNVNFSYRNQYAMTLPGFMPNVGDAFGQSNGSVLAPGLGFAFGLTGDSYVETARENGWLMCDDNVATPATTSATEDFQVRATLEPMRDLKIDLNASRTVNKARSIQFMYVGSPTTYSGSFNMTTISIRSALEGMGDANNGYSSHTFDEFCGKVAAFRDRVQAQYPTGEAASKVVGGAGVNNVDPYSADVLIPAFLDTYTMGAGGSLDVFPAITRLLPNWSIRYSGLSKLTWMQGVFKSFNINHSYKSIYSVGSYASYSSWLEYMGDLGYVKAADGSYTPSSRYNISTVSINEAFSPLLGIDMTFNNNMTCKVEYRTTRVLNLSMTSVQINESNSKDWVIGMGYKISDFNFFGATKSRKVKGSKKNNNDDSKNKQQTTKRKGVNHDLNTRLDISFRKQAAITRDIASGVSSASSGNSALKISLAADYTLSRLLTVSAYYDRQTNTPLLSSSSYPTTTQDFGVSMKFSLTR